MQGEGADFGTRMHGHRFGIVQQLGDAEVQQAHVAGRRDQDVGRLEVAVDDQVRVCVADGLADLQEQREPRFHAHVVGLAVIGDRHALDVFQRQVGLALAADAGIEQACDVGVFEAREDLALTGEAQPQVGVGQPGAQQLQRDPALVQPIRAGRQPDQAHPAFAQQGLELVGADPHAGFQLAGLVDQRLVDEAVAFLFQREQRLELARGVGIIRAQDLQLVRARLRLQLQQDVEQR